LALTEGSIETRDYQKFKTNDVTESHITAVMPGYEYETLSAFPIAGTKVFRAIAQ